MDEYSIAALEIYCMINGVPVPTVLTTWDNRLTELAIYLREKFPEEA